MTTSRPADLRGVLDNDLCIACGACAVADSSDWPPERNTTPGCAAGTVRFSTRTVRSATSSTPACLGLFLPETHMLALRITYSGCTL